MTAEVTRNRVPDIPRRTKRQIEVREDPIVLLDGMQLIIELDWRHPVIGLQTLQGVHIIVRQIPNSRVRRVVASSVVGLPQGRVNTN